MKNGFIERFGRNLLIGSALLQAPVIGCECAQNERQQISQSTRDASREALTKKDEITIGNVRLHLVDAETADEVRKTALFLNIEKAYRRLADYFGEDVMTHDEALEFPLRLAGPDDDSNVIWDIPLTLNAADLEPYVSDKIRPKEVIIGDISEANLGHELIHIFLQKKFLSQAFNEGHAGALAEIIFKDQPKTSDRIVALPALQKLFACGQDYSIFDEHYRGGPQNHLLRMATEKYWKKVWADFGRKHPDFFKKFYREVRRESEQGNNHFSKTVLRTIAARVEPSFSKWYEEVGSLKDIGETGACESVGAVRGEGRIVIANMKSTPRKKTGK